MATRVAAVAALAVMLAAASCSGENDATDTLTGTDDPTTIVDQAATETDPHDDTTGAADETDGAEEEGATALDHDLLMEQLDSSASPQPDATDLENLAFMREEEKLAGDVYLALHEAWGLPVFDNIQAAEQTHTDSVKALLDLYGVADPAAGLGVGEFENDTIQGLYDDLVARGTTSMTEALTVGALIEELDITDLQARASANPNIALVYANLERGSRNHLRAFTRQLERMGETYSPVHLSQDAFDDIVSTPTERGPSQ